MTDKFDKARQNHGANVFVEAGRKGGLANVPKGFAIWKLNDPKGYKQFCIDREAKKRAKKNS